MCLSELERPMDPDFPSGISLISEVENLMLVELVFRRVEIISGTCPRLSHVNYR
jgi:hypothetical protein